MKVGVILPNNLVSKNELMLALEIDEVLNSFEKCEIEWVDLGDYNSPYAEDHALKVKLDKCDHYIMVTSIQNEIKTNLEWIESILISKPGKSVEIFCVANTNNEGYLSYSKECWGTFGNVIFLHLEADDFDENLNLIDPKKKSNVRELVQNCMKEFEKVNILSLNEETAQPRV